MAIPILKTKLYVPTPSTRLIARPRLIEKLNKARFHKLSLISAPAGFGKTTLVSDWLRKSDLQGGWLTLDHRDNDPIRFLSYVIAVLQQLNPKIGCGIQTSLQSSPIPSFEMLATTLINEISAKLTQFIFVLDDYHVIESKPIHDLLTFLLDNLPERLHLVIISRMDPLLPLSRLRARVQLIELSEKDLRFTMQETTAFLSEIMELNLSPTNVAALEAHTEGWIAGLQLAALSMQGRKDILTFVETFTGNNRYIFDYLTDEVLNRQSEEIQRFLLYTSILNRLTGSLCNAVTDGTDGQTSLEQLERLHLFITPLDDERCWYRYHQLFAELLRSRLEQHHPEIVSQLYWRACNWHKEQGLLEEALNYAIEGQDYKSAADILEEIGHKTFWRGKQESVCEWLKSLPHEFLNSRPDLRILYAYVQIDMGQMRSAEKVLERLKLDLEENQTLTESERSILHGKLAAVRAPIAYHCYMDAHRTKQLGLQSLEILPKEDYHHRCVAAFHSGGAYTILGDLIKARQLLEEALVTSKLAGNPVITLLTMCNLGELSMVAGHLKQAENQFEEAYQFAHEMQIQQGNIFSNAIVGLGRLHYEWNHLETAWTYLDEGITLAEQGEFMDRLISGYTAVFQLNIAQGNLNGAREILEKAEQAAKSNNNPPMVIEQIALLQVRLVLAEGKITEAEDWAKKLSSVKNISALDELKWFTLAKVQIGLKNFKEAIVRLKQLLKLANSQGRIRSVIHIETLLATAYFLNKQIDNGKAELRKALELAKPEGYLRVFLDEGEPIKVLLYQLLETEHKSKQLTLSEYIRKLLGAFEPVSLSSRYGQHSPDLKYKSDLLTPRELDVLNLIAEGLSYSNITDQLTITENTLKFHIKNIYPKLSVNNRMQAVIKAKSLGIL